MEEHCNIVVRHIDRSTTKLNSLFTDDHLQSIEREMKFLDRAFVTLSRSMHAF